MYRALTWWFMTEQVDPTDTDLIAARAAEPSVEVSTDPDDPWTRVNGGDVSSEIRTQEVSAKVSAVARVPAVREHLIARQRAIIAAADPGVVAEGRDIGTVVAPDAGLKVYLTASAAIRARRRTRQDAAAGRSSTVDDTRADVDRRDSLDTRTTPLRPADDAIEVDTTDLNVDGVISTLLSLVDEHDMLADSDAAVTR